MTTKIEDPNLALGKFTLYIAFGVVVWLAIAAAVACGVVTGWVGWWLIVLGIMAFRHSVLLHWHTAAIAALKKRQVGR